MKANVRPDYRAKRRFAYPSTGDQLDAIWKTLERIESQSPDMIDSDTRSMLDTIKQTKRRFGKHGTNSY